MASYFFQSNARDDKDSASHTTRWFDSSPKRLRMANLAVVCGSLCDECRKAKDKRRSRGRNPYTSKAHRLARARVLARDPRCVCPGDGPDGCGRHHGLCGAPSTIADHWPLERVELIEAGLDPNDPTRMRGLCKRCHDSKTARTKPSGFNGRSLR